MKSLLTEFKDDNSDFWRWTEHHVDQDQIVVNYTAGTGGEWFAGFLATHEDLADLNTDMRAKKVNKQNRWRINSDLVADVWIFSKSNEKQKNGKSSHDKKENDCQ